MSRPTILSFDQIKDELFTQWDITGHQLNRHLLSMSLTGTPDVVADLITFPPGFVHHMHRHPHADQFVLPLKGSVRFAGVPGRFVDLAPGQLLVVPRNSWHEVRNTSDEDCQVFHFFTGVGAIEDIGFEPWDSSGAPAE
ncbi:cupin domain-containing protein [Amycolatopsis pigmentata]|uniref:Cupin domain-containing protein n=1 Tax=Amycolatopsis pigmentata TaxID=450801 RepID=A0ABW5FIX1_9PSEU